MNALTADWLQARAAVGTGGHLAGRPGGRIPAACGLRLHSEQEHRLRLHPPTGRPSGHHRLLAERPLLDRVDGRQAQGSRPPQDAVRPAEPASWRILLKFADIHLFLSLSSGDKMLLSVGCFSRSLKLINE